MTVPSTRSGTISAYGLIAVIGVDIHVIGEDARGMTNTPQHRLAAIAANRPESWWAAVQRIAERGARTRSERQALATALRALS